MDAVFLRKTFALIAKGLVEKEQLLQKEPTRYPHSRALQHGINMFLAASHQIGGVSDITQYADEASFLKFQSLFTNGFMDGISMESIH